MDTNDFQDMWWAHQREWSDIEALRGALPLFNDANEKWAALGTVSTILHDMIDYALNGDPRCGEFLASLAAVIQKNKRKFCDANSHFAETYAKLASARPTTRKGSELREIITQIIRNAIVARRCFLFNGQKLAPVAHINTDDLRVLPVFGTDEAVVTAWSEIVVYPTLKRMEPVLRKHPVIGRMKKALESGKFHISSLRPLVRPIVVRIAQLPDNLFFDISDIRQRVAPYVRAAPVRRVPNLVTILSKGRIRSPFDRITKKSR